MINSELMREGRDVTSETRPPRVGVAEATSTSKEASCAPTSTTSLSHWTSSSTTSSAPTPGSAPAAVPACRTRSWSAWRSPRSCSLPGRSPLAPVLLLPAWPPVPLPARPARLQQAPACRRAPAAPGHPPPGHRRAVVVRPGAAAGCHPIPCGTSRQTAKRSDLWGLADYGWCASHSRWYWGLKL